MVLEEMHLWTYIKVFETLNHDLFISKLDACGFQYDALKFIYSCLFKIYLFIVGREKKLIQRLVVKKS